jgi:hypothetical protein
MASTAEELSGQAEQLAEMIAFFTLNEAPAAGAHTVRQEPAHRAQQGKEVRRQPALPATERAARADLVDDEFERY